MRRLFPHPYLTLLLTAVWVMLTNALSAGVVVFGLILGTLIPLATAAYWPDRPRLRSPIRVAAYVLLVIWDILVANVAVAMIVLFKPNRALRPAWVTVPVDLRSPEAITVLAGTITMTPGTVSAELAADGRSILVHALHAPDPSGVAADIKTRYERRLKEIFE
ncbi:MAG: Na+/H+ antiporter subunit E [Gemmobacter sp.]|jgi:multicomponent K+:H+ antiporter subunit E